MRLIKSFNHEGLLVAMLYFELSQKHPYKFRFFSKGIEAYDHESVFNRDFADAEVRWELEDFILANNRLSIKTFKNNMRRSPQFLSSLVDESGIVGPEISEWIDLGEEYRVKI